ncbi:hypothetical protein P4110_08580 [Pseudomonas aeruginosa]|nr:hypothetical protein [Pseudomonas aeruginosa]
MKLWLQNLAWQLGVALGLIEPPRMQPIPVENDEQRRRLPRGNVAEPVPRRSGLRLRRWPESRFWSIDRGS